MPSILTHWLLGSKFVTELRHDKRIAQFRKCSFLWGCQGPDILFFHRILPWWFGQNWRAYGYKMHTGKPSLVFDSLVRLLSECDDDLYDDVLCYSLGMCCHYCYDSMAHPYVNWLGDCMRKDDSRGPDYPYHTDIETTLDTIMLRNDTGYLPCDLDLKDCLKAEGRSAQGIELANRWLLRDLFGIEMTQKSARQLIPDMRAVFLLMRDPKGAKRQRLQKFEKLFKLKPGAFSSHMMLNREGTEWDYANTGHALWHNPNDPSMQSSQDFFELTDASEQKTWDMISFFLEAVQNGSGDFAAYTGERSFSFGAPATVTPKQDKAADDL